MYTITINITITIYGFRASGIRKGSAIQRVGLKGLMLAVSGLQVQGFGRKVSGQGARPRTRQQNCSCPQSLLIINIYYFRC